MQGERGEQCWKRYEGRKKSKRWVKSGGKGQQGDKEINKKVKEKASE